MSAQWQRRALDLARAVSGRTSPNPAVGAVLVKDGIAVGEGATRPAGGPHAEVVALKAAGKQARGATLYVTLEPCCHYGNTPPCTDALITSGVAVVCYAIEDPNPLVAGHGHRALAKSGIQVTAGEGPWVAEARRVNETFFHWITTARPFVIAKWAMSLDGRIATRTGNSRWITGEQARRRVHEMRDTTDAILVGSGTVLTDDPALTTRLAKPDVRHPLRIVVDARGRVPLTARIVAGELPGRTLVATTDGSPHPWRKALIDRGNEVLLLPSTAGAGVDLQPLLDCLGGRQITSLLVEGGATVLSAFVHARLVNKYAVFVAPFVIGGSGAPGPVAGPGVALLADAPRFVLEQVERLGEDVCLTCYPLDAAKLPAPPASGIVQLEPSGQGVIPDRR